MSGNAQLDAPLEATYILGAGSVGLIFAYYCQHNQPVCLITRKPAVANFCYQFDGIESTLNVVTATLARLAKGTIKQLIVTVKSYQLDEALNEVWPYLHPDACIIISHNGMSDLTPWQSRLGASQQLWFATTNQGGFKSDTYSVVHKGIGATWFGALSASTHTPKFITNLCKVIPQSAIHPDIALLRWQKLFINIAINPLTAAEQVTNGALRAPQYASTVIGLLNEAVHVAKLCNIAISLAEALSLAYLVMQQTANNRSSMLQDVSMGRKTEIAAMCGFIVDTAKQFDYPTPYNLKLLQAITEKSA